MISTLFAESTSPVQTAAPSPIFNMVPLIVIFIIFYFLLIMPQQKKMKKHKEMLNNIKIGDKIITSSGFYATVVALGDVSLDVKLADNVKVKILRSSVSEILGSQEPAVTSK